MKGLPKVAVCGGGRAGTAIAGDLALMGMGAPVLEVMRRMAGPAASAGVSLYELSMSSGRLTAKGRAGSFEQAVKFKSGLLGLKDAGDVALTDVKTSVSGGVTFSLSMELGGMELGGAGSEGAGR